MEFFLCFASSETLSKHSIDPPQYLIFQNRERKVSVEKEGGGGGGGGGGEGRGGRGKGRGGRREGEGGGGGGSIHSNLNVRGLSHVVVADGARFQIYFSKFLKLVTVVYSSKTVFCFR